MRQTKRLLLVFGILLIMTSLGIIVYLFILNNSVKSENKKQLQKFYEKENIEVEIEKIDDIQENDEIIEKQEEYIGVLKIPKINFERGFYSKTSPKNTVSQNIELLDDSDMPDKENGNVMIAGHSGTAKIAYFSELKQLKIGDIAEIIYQKHTYQYEIVNIYDVEKNGMATVKRNPDCNTLTLITCRDNTDQQIIIVSELKNVLQR